MKKIIIMLAAVAAASLTSCSLFRKSEKAVTVDRPGESQQADLVASSAAVKAISGEWAVISLNGEPLKINGDNRPKFTFTPSKDVKGAVDVIGFNGCNYINGVYKVGDGRLTKAGEFLTSLMACPDAPYESEINLALDKVTGYTVATGNGCSTLTLTADNGRPVMVLRNHSLSFLNGAWKVERIDNRTVPASAQVKVVIDIDSETIHGNAGCNLLNGGLILNLDVMNGLEFSNLSTTRMTCPDIETEQAFLVALEEVKAAREIDNDNVALLDSKGATLISLRRIERSEIEEQ